jgi:hypothetical protein
MQPEGNVLQNGLKISLIFHLGIFLLLFFGLPAFQTKRDYEQQVVAIEVLPVSEITNVKAKSAEPKPDPKEEVITKNAPKIAMADPNKPAPKPEVKTEPMPKPALKPEVKKESIKVKPLEKLKPKVEERKTEERKKDKPKAKEDDFAAVVKSVEEARKRSDEKKQDKKTDEDFNKAVDFLANAKESQYKEGLPMSLNEKDAIRQQIMKNWTVPSGAKDIQNIVATLHINVQPDGTISKVEVKNQSRYNSDQSFRAMADSAMRAVYKSSPLQHLPAEKYDVKDGWREMEINFDPREMVY